MAALIYLLRLTRLRQRGASILSSATESSAPRAVDCRKGRARAKCEEPACQTIPRELGNRQWISRCRDVDVKFSLSDLSAYDKCHVCRALPHKEHWHTKVELIPFLTGNPKLCFVTHYRAKIDTVPIPIPTRSHSDFPSPPTPTIHLLYSRWLAFERMSEYMLLRELHQSRSTRCHPQKRNR